MNERIKAIRIAEKLSTRDFSARLGMNHSSISLLENGKRNPTSQFITSLCREFKINEHWFRTGEGEMYVTISKEEKIAELVLELAKNDDYMAIEMSKLLLKMTPEQIKALYNFMLTVIEKDHQ